jgi:hypothetical protein
MSNNRIIELLVTPLENNIRISQKRITELEEKLKTVEAENREVKRMNREERLILEAKLCELEKIAKEGLSECFCGWGKVHPETCPNCINLKKIDELMGRE